MRRSPLTLAALEAEHALLAARLHALPADSAGGDEATLLWSALGIVDAQRVPDLDVDAVRALRTDQLRSIGMHWNTLATQLFGADHGIARGRRLPARRT